MTFFFAQDFDDSALRLNPVVECNFGCHYCAVGLDIPRIKRCGLEDWARGFDRIPHGIFNVVSISGGEPLLLKHLPELCNAATRHSLPVRVYTNLSLDVEPVLLRLARSIHWRATIHPETEHGPFLKNLKALRDARKPAMVVTVVAVRGMGMESAAAWLEREGFPVAWDTDLWGRNEKTQGHRPGVWSCTNHIWLFGPDGRRYPCVRHLMTPMHGGPFFWEVDWSKDTRQVTTSCRRFGDCLSCDGLIKSEVSA